MNDQILQFLKRMDNELARDAREGERLDLYHLGRSALVLQHGFPLSTTDFDIVLMRDSPLEQTVIEKFGKGTPAATELGLYIDPVPQAVPPVPQWFKKRCQQVHGGWKVLRLWSLRHTTLLPRS